MIDPAMMREMMARRMRDRSDERLNAMPYGARMQEMYIQPRVNQMSRMLPQPAQPQRNMPEPGAMQRGMGPQGMMPQMQQNRMRRGQM